MVGLLFIVSLGLLIFYRIRKSNEGSYLVPWDSARTAGVLSYVGKFLRYPFSTYCIVYKMYFNSDDSDAGSTDDELNESKGITSLTPFLERKGLDFSDPNTVVVKNFDIL